MNFIFEGETAFVSYLDNAITSSLTDIYPILVGHTPVTSSEDLPKIAVTIEGYEPVTQNAGVFKAHLAIDVCTVMYDADAYVLHDIAVQWVDAVMNNQQLIQNYMNSASASFWVAGIEYGNVTAPFEGIRFAHNFNYTVTAKVGVASSSVSYHFPNS